MTAYSIFLAENARTDLKHKWYYILFSVMLTQTVLACYQILAVVYITGTVAVFLITTIKKELTLKQQIQWIGFHAGIFIIGLTVYLTIAQLFFMSGSGYLKGQILWTKIGLVEGLHQCFKAIRYSLKNNPPFYTGFYDIFSILLIVLTVCRMIQNRKIKRRSNVIILLAEFFLILSPYVFVFFYGGGIMPRMQLVMPLSQGCILYLIVLIFPDRAIFKTKVQKIFVQGIILFFAATLYKDTISHLNYCNRLYYTYDWVFQYDTEISKKLYWDIKEAKDTCGLEDSFDEILFVGYPDIPYNMTCHTGLDVGVSFFQRDITVTMPFRYRI